MGDRLRAGVPPRYVTSHPGQLSLAIPLWVGAMSTGDGFSHRYREKQRVLRNIGPCYLDC